MNLEYWNDQFNRVDVLEEEILRCATDSNARVVVCAQGWIFKCCPGDV